jgi:hypothetical protein
VKRGAALFFVATLDVLTVFDENYGPLLSPAGSLKELQPTHTSHWSYTIIIMAT